MTHDMAVSVAKFQIGEVKKVNGSRFFSNGYEYKVKYEGGFSMFASVWKRPVGKRNFKYCCGMGLYHCVNSIQALHKLIDLVTEGKK